MWVLWVLWVIKSTGKQPSAVSLCFIIDNPPVWLVETGTALEVLPVELDLFISSLGGELIF